MPNAEHRFPAAPILYNMCSHQAISYNYFSQCCLIPEHLFITPILYLVQP
jgi:hypothetical protein